VKKELFIKKILCFLMSIALLNVSISSIYASTKEIEGKDSEIIEKTDELETTDEKIVEKEVTVVREVEEERAEYSTKYLNSDGTYSIRFYSSPIRYRDEKGKLHDIDTSIEELDSRTKEKLDTEYDYRSKSTEVEVLLPREISSDKPVVLAWDKYKAKLSPITDNSAEELKEYKDVIKTRLGSEELSDDKDEIVI